MRKITQSKQERSYWAAKKRFPDSLLNYADVQWWTDIRKTVVDIMINKASSTGAFSCSLWELPNKAFTTRSNVSKIIAKF